jgi:hypothetical protein
MYDVTLLDQARFQVSVREALEVVHHRMTGFKLKYTPSRSRDRHPFDRRPIRNRHPFDRRPIRNRTLLLCTMNSSALSSSTDEYSSVS